MHQHHLDSGKWSARCIVKRQASPAPSAKSTRRTAQQLTLMQLRRTHRKALASTYSETDLDHDSIAALLHSRSKAVLSIVR